ncbi:MAG: T9SS type A sorting domain-containing protein, partial [Saprospiraceae bacterium]
FFFFFCDKVFTGDVSEGRSLLEAIVKSDLVVMSDVLNFDVFPNPFKNNFSIYLRSELGGMSKVVISDVTGTNISSENYLLDSSQSVIEIPMVIMAPGLYFISVIDSNNNRVTKRIMKL